MKSVLLTIMRLLMPMMVNAQENVKYQLSTHILDVNAGKPIEGVEVQLFEYSEDGLWSFVDKSVTDKNGRIADFLPETKDNLGVYKLKFATSEYFEKQNIESIYPFVEIVFSIKDMGHYHIPLAMSANGYSTYRGN